MRISFLSLLPFLLVATPVLAQTPEKPAADKPAKAEKPAADTKAAAVDFEKQIWPILEKSCIECHSTAAPGPDGKMKKPKGGVVLDSKDGITTSKKGKLIAAKKPDDSMLFTSISLPADDDDRMPPKKKGAPLPQDQQDLIKKWIEAGAEFGTWTGKKADDKAKDAPKGKEAEAGGDKGKDKPADKPKGSEKEKEAPHVRLQKGLQPVPAATLAAFANGPFLVQSLGDESPLLRVGCAGRSDEVDDAALRTLAPIATHIAELELARSRVGDAACETIAAMPRLLRVDLRQTQVGDGGVAKLAACKELRDVNLFGTKTGDYAMAALGGLKALQNVYVWQTEVSAGAVVRLREQVPGARVVFAAELPEPMAEGAGGARRRAQK
jgi:hypothetical protein